MTLQGQPVVTNFNIDLAYSINWDDVRASLSTQPAFLFQNNNGFTHVLSEGSYSWVMPTTSDYGIGYLSNFYNTGMAIQNDETVGATYKGFNDTLASWGSNRIMSQQCGQTWLQTFSKLNGYYNSGNQLPLLQLVTWNDFGEGTVVEPTQESGYRDLGIIQDCRRQYLDASFSCHTNDFDLAELEGRPRIGLRRGRRRKRYPGRVASVPNAQRTSLSPLVVEKKIRIAAAADDPGCDSFVGVWVETACHRAVQVCAHFNQVVAFDHGLAQEILVV